MAAASRSACISVCLPYLVTTDVPGSVGMTTFVYARCLHPSLSIWLPFIHHAFRTTLSSGMQRCVVSEVHTTSVLGLKSKPKRLASKLLLKFLRNIGELVSGYMASRPRRQDSSQLPLSEPQIERGHFQCTNTVRRI